MGVVKSVWKCVESGGAVVEMCGEVCWVVCVDGAEQCGRVKWCRRRQKIVVYFGNDVFTMKCGDMMDEERWHDDYILPTLTSRFR